MPFVTNTAQHGFVDLSLEIVVSKLARMAQFRVALVLMLSLLNRNELESSNLCYAVRYKSKQTSGKQQDVGARIIPHPDIAAKIRKNKTDFLT